MFKLVKIAHKNAASNMLKQVRCFARGHPAYKSKYTAPLLMNQYDISPQ